MVNNQLLNLFKIYQFLSYIIQVNGFHVPIPEIFSTWKPLTSNYIYEYQNFPASQKFFLNCLTQFAAANTSAEVPMGFVPLYPAVTETLNSELIDPPLKAAIIVLLALGQAVIAGIGSPTLNSLAGGSSAVLANHLLTKVLKISGGASDLNFKPQFRLPEFYEIKFGLSANPKFVPNCSQIIQDMIENSKSNQYNSFLARSKNIILDLPPVVPAGGVLLPAVSVINSGLFIASAIVGTSIVGLAIVGGLVLFQKAERKKYVNIDNKSVIIDIDILII